MFYEKEISTVREHILNHELYRVMASVEDVQTFMEYHVWAVWDFMTLLKGLQQKLTCVSVPWVPKGDPKIRLMINEIVMGEESDEVVGGLSHFEWYLMAMDEVGANRAPIDCFIEALRAGRETRAALAEAELPQAAASFVAHTLDIVSRGQVHEIAAAFTVGRENLIPDMFPMMIKSLRQPGRQQVDMFCAYMERHVEVDGEEHGPLSRKMMALLCEDSQQKVSQAYGVALEALEMRKQLWDGALAGISIRDKALAV